MEHHMTTSIGSDLATMLGTLPLPSAVSPAPAGHGASGGPSFAALMQNAIGKVNQHDDQASQRMRAVDSGASDDLVGAMLASQEASLSFSMLMQVRNKVMGAVDELIKLPL
jgi:flagellar hook-basal body complex protein FliE